MHRDSFTLTFSILRNTAAMLVVAVFSKAMGLVIAVLVARFLGPAAMGLFALLFSIAFLVENVTPLGLQDFLVREVAARPTERIALWKQAMRIAIGASLIPSLAFAVAAYIYRGHEEICGSLVILAFGMPFAATAIVSQAVLQGLEKVLYLTWTTFLTRVASLVALVLMFIQGAGVEAAFVSKLMFQVCSAALFVYAIFRDRPTVHEPTHARIALAATLPFAFNKALLELTTRAPLLLLPVFFGLKQIGIFDAADRIRLTLGITAEAATTGIMPAFSRSFAGAEANRHALVSYSVKYLCIIVSIAAAFLSIFANSIIILLYGQAFSQSVLLLQVLVWAQMFLAMDAVVKQAMIAHGKEYVVVTRAVAGLACLAALFIVLARSFGLLGAAVAVLLSAAVTLALDLRYAVREVLAMDIAKFVLKPLACGLLVGSVLLLLGDASPLIRLGAGVLAYTIFAMAIGLLPRDERVFLRAAVGHVQADR